MEKEQKQKLFPYFAYLYSQELNPEKYGKATTMEEWSTALQENQEDVDTIVAAAEKLTDEEWENLAAQYSKVQEESQAISAKKGAILKKLQASKSIVTKTEELKDKPIIAAVNGGKISLVQTLKKGGKKKKCSCGCNLVIKKLDGGKVTETCSCKCGGKMKKTKKK